MDNSIVFGLLWFSVGFLCTGIQHFKAYKNGVDFTVKDLIYTPLFAGLGFTLLLEYADLLGPAFTKLMRLKLIKGRRR